MLQAVQLLEVICAKPYHPTVHRKTQVMTFTTTDVGYLTLDAIGDLESATFTFTECKQIACVSEYQ